MFKTGEEAADFLMHRQGHHCGYPKFQEVMAEIGDPQDAFHTIHVAGTNGKGSTSNYISEILQASGYRVGMYTSPYLVHHYDRIRINGEWISDADFCRYANQIYPLIDKYNLSMFECDTMIACLYFKEAGVDYAVMEAGVGGRRDATNTIHHPDLAVLTTVGMDHMSSLGETIPDIAWEKAGIIKPGCPILTGYLLPEAQEVVDRRAFELEGILHRVRPYEDLGSRRFALDGVTYELSSSAEYQKRNASTALQAVKLLGKDISQENVVKAVKRSQWAGRFETVSEHPLVILDGAHNPEGITALMDSFGNLPHPIVTVFSALRDKQGKTMAEMLRNKTDRLIVTEFESYRADQADSLSDHPEEIILDWKKAIDEAMKAVHENGTVIVSGSLYFISTVRAYFGNNCSK